MFWFNSPKPSQNKGIEIDYFTLFLLSFTTELGFKFVSNIFIDFGLIGIPHFIATMSVVFIGAMLFFQWDNFILVKELIETKLY